MESNKNFFKHTLLIKQRRRVVFLLLGVLNLIQKSVLSYLKVLLLKLVKKIKYIQNI